MRVSRYCLGAMMFGAMGNRDEAECIRIVHAALDAGINFVDTADAYSGGESERILAKALAGRREKVVLATKCFFPTGRDVNEGGGSRRWIVRAVEESLRRLEHRLDRRLPAPPPRPGHLARGVSRGDAHAARAGQDPRDGHVRHAAETIVEAQWISERRGLARVRSEQCIYSIFARGWRRAVLPACRRSASA